MKRSTLFSALLALGLCLAGSARALDPLPQVVQGAGFKTWTLQADLPLLKLEDALSDLRSTDSIRHDRVLAALGMGPESMGRGEYALPEIDGPAQVVTQFLSFDRRKLAVLTAPVRGHHRWYAVILRQEGNGEAYWRAFQVFVFDTDPEKGLVQDFPDILGDDVRFWEVGHTVKDDIYGRAQATSIFRYDDVGRMRLTYQELSNAYLTAKFMGHSLRLKQTLVFHGDQRIVRKLAMSSYPWMRREEFDQYMGVQADQAQPSKVWALKESFDWDPADFDFYNPDQELDKLMHAESPFIRAAAAHRLGERLKTAPAGLSRAVWKDKNPIVRITVALALAEIGDPAALPDVDKALHNYNEDDTVVEALGRAQTVLLAAKAAASSGAAAPSDGGDAASPAGQN